MKGKTVVLGLSVAILVILGFVYQSGKTDSSEDSIKIGVIGPFTGDLAFLGDGLRNAILVAEENLGSTRHKYEILFEDDRFDPKTTASAAQKLINIDKVDALISFSSGTGKVVTPIAEKAQVVHFGVASDLTVADGQYNFNHWTPPSEEAKLFVSELVKRGYKKLGIVLYNQSGVFAVRDAVREELFGTDIQIVDEEIFNPGENDFRTLVTKLSQKSPDIILIASFSPEIELITKEVKRQGITVPLTSIESFELSPELDLFEGYWYINAAVPNSEFQNKFKEKTGGNPTEGAANGYDIVNLIVHASEKSKKRPSTAEIVLSLNEVKDFPGALGPLTVDNEGVVHSKASVKIIKDGKPELVY